MADIDGLLIDTNTSLERMASALERIASPDETVRAMREHCAETDHVLELRLIDIDIFAVRCAGCTDFRKEWRTR